MNNHFLKIWLAPIAARTFILSAVFILGAVAWQLVGFREPEEPETDETYLQYFRENYKIFALTIPRQMEFAGEEVPLHLIDVRERLDREMLVNTYWQSQTLLFFKRANRWFPVIEPILAEHGIPDDFKYLCLVESGMMNVVSPAGATGYWQLMKETAIQYGLEVNAEVDERYHVEKSTHAACKLLREAYRKYGSWSMCAAAYNMGITGVQKQINRQKVYNYYDLLLNDETSRYLFRILAVKAIMTDPAKHGFYFRQKDLYPPYEVDKLEIDSSIADFADFATQLGLNYKTLKLLNPWLRDTYLNNPSRKQYILDLPKPGSLYLYELPLSVPDTAPEILKDTTLLDSIR